MPIEITREGLLAFRYRRWDLVREAKEAFWAEETHRRGADAGVGAGEGLWAHARAQDPSWPSPASRADDFAHHVALCEKLQRVADVIARR